MAALTKRQEVEVEMAEFEILRFPGGTRLEICVSQGQVSSLETKKSKV